MGSCNSIHDGFYHEQEVQLPGLQPNQKIYQSIFQIEEKQVKVAIQGQANRLLEIIEKYKNEQQWLNIQQINSFYSQGSDNVYVILEYFSKNLQIQQDEMKDKNLHYTDGEAKNLIIEVLTQVKYFLQTDQFLLNLNLSEIFLDKQNAIKIKNLSVQSLQQYNYQDYLMDAKKNKTYLAPEELNGIRTYLFQEQANVMINSYKSSIFQIGMILLGILVQDNLYDVYDYQQYFLNYYILKSKINFLYSRYSQNIVDIIQIMIEEDPDMRPSIEYVLQKLNNSSEATLTVNNQYNQPKYQQYIQKSVLSKFDSQQSNFNSDHLDRFNLIIDRNLKQVNKFSSNLQKPAFNEIEQQPEKFTQQDYQLGYYAKKIDSFLIKQKLEKRIKEDVQLESSSSIYEHYQSPFILNQMNEKYEFKELISKIEKSKLETQKFIK